MYRPLTSNWVQPIASFATKGAAKGNALQKIIMEAIMKLESVGAQVVNVVADGAKTNKNFWKLLGVTGKTKRVVNKVQHPYDENRILFFLCDVPHLIKCIRNHFRKYGIVKFNGKTIDFKYYEKLFEEDKLRQCGLRKCYKLTKSHINPNSFEKMNVSYATQLFSRSVATGIEFYRQQKVAGFENSGDTQNFTLKMNNLFDALNGRFSKEGIRPNSPQLPMLKFWLNLLQGDVENNTFASSETLSALRITLKSVIEISEYLLTELEFKYVLTNKLNQDPCEKFFGLVRGAGGDEDHPTVCNFMQLYRILSLYTPTKRILNTNIAGGENETVLLEFQESLKSKSKLVAKRKMK